MTTQPYSRDEIRKVGRLFHRAAHLVERTRGKPHLTYDLQEIAAILWVVEQVVEWRGPLPDDLMSTLTSLRADVPLRQAAEPGVL